MRALNWGLPITAVLVVLGALLLGAASPLYPPAPTPARAVVPAEPDLPLPDAEPVPQPTEPAEPEPTPRKPKPKPKPTLTACDANITVKPRTTTCGFAENVFYGYWMNEEEPGVFADSPGIPAYSPAAEKLFFVDCSGERTIVCTAGDGGYAKFPAKAIAAYTSADAETYAATHELGDVPPPGDAEDAPAEPLPGDGEDCDPNYAGECLDPTASDYDCAGGDGGGPQYTGQVEIIGADPHDLDRDGDGIACEPY